MKNTTANKYLLTIAAATCLLIPGASADPLAQVELVEGDGGLPTYCYDNGRVAVAINLFDDPCAQTCVGAGNVNVAVTVSGDVSQCSKDNGDPVTCVGNINIAVNLYGEVSQCTSYGPGGHATCIATVNIAIQWVVSSVDQCSAIAEDAFRR